MVFPALFWFSFRIFLILWKYSFVIIFVISLLFIESNCNTPRYPFSSFSDFIFSQFCNSIPSLCNTNIFSFLTLHAWIFQTASLCHYWKSLLFALESQVLTQFCHRDLNHPEIFWEYRFQQGILGQEPKRT